MKKVLLLSVAMLLWAGQAKAAKLFDINLTQGALSESRAYDSIMDVFDDYEDGGLNKIISSYDEDAASTGLVNFRGIPMDLIFGDGGSDPHWLKFKVDSLGINEEFKGSTQRESFKMLKDYLKKNNEDLLQKILKAGVEQTPFDAVAGNPNSLMSQMVESSYARAGGNAMGTFLGYLAPNAAKHTISYHGQDVNALTMSLPIGATFNFGDSGWALLWDMPLDYTDMEGSVSYMAQIGLGLKIPLAKYWSVTPAVRAGIVGSEDMLSGGILYNGTLTSDIAIPVGNWTLGMTNMAGIIRDYSVKVKGYEVDYDMKNQVFKNGVHVRYDINDKYVIASGYNYTFYTGDKMYIDSYHDIEIDFTRKMEGFISGIALVGNYTFDKNYKAYRMGLKFSF